MENCGGFVYMLLYKLIAKLTKPQENGFLLCCVKLGENNFNKRSSCHKKYKTTTKCALTALNGKLTNLSTLNF